MSNNWSDVVLQRDLRDYIRTLRRRWLTVAMMVVLFLALAGGLDATRPRVYAATARLLVERPPGSAQLDTVPANRQDADRNLQNEIAFLQSGAVKTAVRQRLGFSPDVTVSGSTAADVISVTARSRKPATAALIANVYADSFSEQRRQTKLQDYLKSAGALQSQIDATNKAASDITAKQADLNGQIAAVKANPALDPATRASQVAAIENLLKDYNATNQSKLAGLRSELQLLQGTQQQFVAQAQLVQTSGARIISEATPSTAPVSPKPVRDLALAGFLGLAVGVVLAFVRDHLDDSLLSRDDLERASGLRILGMVPRLDGVAQRHPVTMLDPQAPASEAFHSLRTALQFISVDRQLERVLITSSLTGDGKTTTVANLAVSLARTGRRVICVGCDLRRPALHDQFGVRDDIGFTSVLLGDVSLQDALQPVPDVRNLWVLASGPKPPNPSELLATNAAGRLLRELSAEADLVLIDSPPLLPVADAQVLTAYVDAVVLVASVGTTNRHAIAHAAETLAEIGAPTIGTILNRVDDFSSYGYGYGYGDSKRKDGRWGRSRRRPSRRRRRAGRAGETGTIDAIPAERELPGDESAGGREPAAAPAREPVGERG
ncbi:MAG: polysaccharide biosynthesis tyrosine autokinase [Actinobacteria bacterium]|nr:polysaccharide biosynthesis tyrosine autokinase [Actinomycetota bacterium]